MLSLSTIIKWLMVFLLFELSLFAGYIILFNILEVKNPFQKTQENPVQVSLQALLDHQKELEVKPMVQTIEAPKVVLEEKEEERVEEVKKKTLLEATLMHIEPNSEEDIVHIEDETVQPIIYTKSISLSKLSIEKKKKSFINMIIPAILIAKYRIKEDRKKVKQLLEDENLSKEDLLWLTKKRHIFKSESNNELYEKMEVHPTSIVIAQAIIESGWGTSRFFEEANNLFGIWSFNEYEKRIEAAESRGDKRVYLKKYDNVEQSINDYFMMLSTKDAYQEFRNLRLESQDPFELIKGLSRYSELGDEYIENLKNTIEKNKLLAYDTYRLEL
jgi:Bax protein